MKFFHPKPKENGGFTLVEIMIVVVIIGLLASMAMIAVQQNRKKVLASTFGSDLRVFRDALVQCVTETADYNLGAPAGQLATVFAPYVRKSQWQQSSPIGGKWIVDTQLDGIKLCIGVDGFTASRDTLELADRLFDDGNLNSGYLRLLSAGKFSWIVEQD